MLSTLPRLASLALALALALAGCAVTIPIGDHPTLRASAPEVVYQVANAIDFAQTVNIARSPSCYREADPFTKRIIGQHPSTGAVGAVWAAQATAHVLVTTWLDREVDATDATGWRVARGIWHAVTLGNALRNVVHNAQDGLRPFGGPTIDCERPVVCGRGPCRGRPQ